MHPASIDFPTLVLSLAVLYVVQAVILLALLYSQRDYRPAHYWAPGAIATAIGAAVFVLRGPIIEWVSVIASNILLLGGTILATGGLLLACGRSPPWRMFGAFAAASLAAIAWFQFVDPSLHARIVSYQTGLSGFLLVEIAILLDPRRGPAGTARWLIASGGILCLGIGTARAILPLANPLDNTFVNTAFIWAAFVRCFTQTAGCTMLVGEHYRRELERMSRLDPLTGLLNRRAFDEIADRLWTQARRRRWRIAALMIDIDHFKAVNDRFGHAAGDDVLRAIGAILGHDLRGDDLVGRHGGEEFAVLLPDADAARATTLAERIRQAGAAIPLPDGGGFTLSVGIAIGRGGDGPWNDLLARADQALYQAKAQGRDRVIVLPVTG